MSGKRSTNTLSVPQAELGEVPQRQPFLHPMPWSRWSWKKDSLLSLDSNQHPWVKLVNFHLTFQTDFFPKETTGNVDHNAKFEKVFQSLIWNINVLDKFWKLVIIYTIHIFYLNIPLGYYL